jgi:hypothetical protein
MEGKYRAKEEDIEFHNTHKTDLNAPHQLRPQGVDMEVDQGLEVHSVVTEDVHKHTVHGGLKITNEHGHRKFVPYKAVAEGGHGTEVKSNRLLSFIQNKLHLYDLSCIYVFIYAHIYAFWSWIELHGLSFCRK